jgi:hypothetical protein
MFKLSLCQAIHENPDQSPSGRPARSREIGLAGAGQHETASRRPLIDGTLHRAKNLWHRLPFIHQ